MKIPKIQDCPKCHSTKLSYRAEDGKPHHGRFVCGSCGGFITWVGQQMAKLLNRLEG